MKYLINVSCYNTYDDDNDDGGGSVMSVDQRVPGCRMSPQSFDGDSGEGCNVCCQLQMHNGRKPLRISDRQEPLNLRVNASGVPDQSAQ